MSFWKILGFCDKKLQMLKQSLNTWESLWFLLGSGISELRDSNLGKNLIDCWATTQVQIPWKANIKGSNLVIF